MGLSAAQLDRAAGVLLGQACGDALGVPYEFGRPPGSGERAEMRGGGLGPYDPGEWSDDTQMALCIAQVAATGADLTSDDALDAVAEAFLGWQSGGASDIGNQTRQVLGGTRNEPGERVGARMRAVSRRLHESTGHTAGNGALMRTGVVGLTRLEDGDADAGAGATAAAARAVAELTHFDPLAGDSCVIWSLAVRHAVLHGTFDGVRESLLWIPRERRDQWAARLDEAEAGPPGRFNPNGFTVAALQAAWSAIVNTPVPADDPAGGSFPCLHLQEALHSAVRVGNDTDTVAAIAGALLGARWGGSAVPAQWRRVVHGWPGIRARDLVCFGVLTARGGKPDREGWPSGARMDYASWGDAGQPSPHPADPDVLLGGIGSLYELPDGVDAVVSLCRLGVSEVPAPGVRPEDHVEVWLVDSHHLDDDNPNLDFVVDDAARAVQQLRGEGRRVLLHCVRAESRTPTVGARYGCLLGRSADDAVGDVTAALGPPLNQALIAAVRRLSG